MFPASSPDQGLPVLENRLEDFPLVPVAPGGALVSGFCVSGRIDDPPACSTSEPYVCSPMWDCRCHLYKVWSVGQLISPSYKCQSFCALLGGDTAGTTIKMLRRVGHLPLQDLRALNLQPQCTRLWEQA